MQLKAYFLPGNDRFVQVGIEFTAKTKAGNDRLFFFVPQYKSNQARLYKWIPESSSFKECSIAGVSQKKTESLMQFWESQTDIGLWIAQSRRAAA